MSRENRTISPGERENVPKNGRDERLHHLTFAMEARPVRRATPVGVAALGELRPIADHLVRQLLLIGVERRLREIETKSRRVGGREDVLDLRSVRCAVREAHGRQEVLRRILVVELVREGRDELRCNLVREGGRAGEYRVRSQGADRLVVSREAPARILRLDERHRRARGEDADRGGNRRRIGGGGTRGGGGGG